MDLVLWHQIQVLALMTGAFSLSLCLLKVGILYCVEKVAIPLFVRQLSEELARGFLSPLFLGLVSCLVQVRSLKWSHQKTGL
jgi:hypothetical protein